MNDEDLGLPKPEDYDGDSFCALDYLTGEYATARTLEEAIDIRGARAFLRNVAPDDFINDDPHDTEKIGIAELWSSSTWREGEVERDVARERSASSLKENDLLELRPCSEAVREWGYRFHLADGSVTPYEPYHDYDDLLFQRNLKNLAGGERLICRVRSVSRFGENGIDVDPAFCWRVYSCKVTVYRDRSALT